MNRQVITIATGKKIYTDLAINLARSFFWWNRNTGIKFQLVTDAPVSLPQDLPSKVELILIEPGELGEGFSPKLHLDRLASSGQTLFIDSDCLIYGDLTPVFEQFKGHDVSVVGTYVSSGEWFGDIAAICRKFDIRHLPKFNGGLYYLEKGPGASAVYQRARALEKQYDEIGFDRLRGCPNDEVVMALAMELNGQRPIAEDGSIMSDPQACPGKYAINAVKGERQLVNPPLPSPKHQAWYPFHQVSPLIVHFLGYYTQHHPYRMDAFRLKKVFQHQYGFGDKAYGYLTIAYPQRLKTFVKDAFRPIFHFLFGARRVKGSERA